MKLEKAFLIVAIAAIVLAFPTGYALRYRQLLHVEHGHAGALQLQLHSSQQQLQQRDAQLKATQQDSTKQQQQIKSLQQQLTLKQAAQRAEVARVAAAKLVMPVPSHVSLAGDCGAYRSIVAQYSWDVSVALAIMRAESGCNPEATSPTCDHGLMQINCVHLDLVAGNVAALNDPATNIRIAHQLYSAKGWQPWTTFTSGAYLKFL